MTVKAASPRSASRSRGLAIAKNLVEKGFPLAVRAHRKGLELIAKGVLSIYDGDVPWLVSKKLEGYLSLALRRKAKTAA